MRWLINPLYFSSLTVLGQNSPNSVSSSDKGSSADWAGVVIALGALGFTIWSYSRQERKNREAVAEQKAKDRIYEQKQQERDQSAQRELELVRQKTIRLAWYRDTVKAELNNAYQAFDTLHRIKQDIQTSDLTEDQKDDLSKKYRQATAELRNGLLENIAYINFPIYKKLLDELDTMANAVNEALFNDSLKLSHSDVYDREIGQKIKGSQQRFFQTLYAYKGDE